MTAKKILDSLTPKQEALCDQIAQEYIDDLTVYREPDIAAIRTWLSVAYRLYDLPVPGRIEIVDSPYAALKLAGDLTGESHDYTDWCGTGDGGWVSFYDYFSRIGILSSEESVEILALRDFGRCAWDSVLLDECAIVIRRPTAIRVDADGSMHCSSGPCIEWRDGKRDFAWHGTWIDGRIVMNPKSHTREEYLAITNTETRRALGESAGWQWIADLLGATVIDEWTDPVTSLAYALLRCSDGTQLLRKLSPLLKNGTTPVYFEPVDRALKTAQAARKWQATDLSVDDCEANTELSYGVEA